MSGKHHNNVNEDLDDALQAFVGKFTQGISPAALTLAFLDWYFHLRMHPAKQLALIDLMRENYWQIVSLYLHNKTCADEVCTQETPKDKRFEYLGWEQYPFSAFYQSFLIMQDWWHTAATNVHGISQHHEDVIDFTLRQLLDMYSPSNFPLTNPEIIQTSIEQHGENFVRGAENYFEDLRRYQMNEPPIGSDKFVIGKDVAITPGKVIYRNNLIELIQYSPTTKDVYQNPILITPAWIMKFYILDLIPKHSLVKYLIDKGHTVFMISWKNPTKDDRDIAMQDYLNLGTLSAIDVVSNIIPNEKINLVGYCLGGTLATMTAAYLSRENDDRLNSLTIFAAQTDFTEPGELGLFIDDSQIAFLENMMHDKGYLDTHQMAGAFQLLRSNDLIWSRMIHDYMLGLRKPLNDLMAWNADATRLPYKMHSEYLRKLFLNNELAEGKYIIDGKPIALTDITIPVFVVATERDHVSPWTSVFKINLLTSSNVTFLLTSGGHNVGIVSPPNMKNIKRHYRMSTLKESHRYIDADTWFKQTNHHAGSWWPAWEKWLAKQSGKVVAAPAIGNHLKGYDDLYNAPGTYVLDK